MFSVVGLTLDDVRLGSLPHVRLAEALESQAKHARDTTEAVEVYTTDPADTQGLIARTKYKERGNFLVFLYFSDAAVTACNEFGIPLRILERIEERALPARRVMALEHHPASMQ